MLGLTLALLHEMRLGTESKFWGYTQSLPRTTVPIPALWPLAPEGGGDALRALDWLVGTEADRDIRRRQLEGVGLVSLILLPAIPRTIRRFGTGLMAADSRSLPTPVT